MRLRVCEQAKVLTQRKHSTQMLSVNRPLVLLTLLVDRGEDDPDYKTIAIIVGTVVPGLILIMLVFACCWRYSADKPIDKSKKYRYRGECDCH